MKNESLYNTILSVKNLADLSPAELLGYTKLLRNISHAPGGPFGIGTFSGGDLQTLNNHIASLYAQHGKSLPGAEKFLQKVAITKPSAPKANTSGKHSIAHSSQLSAGAREVKHLCYSAVTEWLQTLAPLIRKQLNDELSRIRLVDGSGEISLLSFLFAEALLCEKPSQKKCIELGTANLLTWISYSIYDQLADLPDSTNVGAKLSAANTSLREAQRLYTLIAPSSTTPQRLFNEVDAAISKEVYLRTIYTSTKQLKARPAIATHKKLSTSKSIAHCIGPLLICEITGQSEKIPSLEKALRLYCSARQLNDDLHDWQEDLMAGHPQYVIARLLVDVRRRAQVCVNHNATLEPPNSVARLRRVFWEYTLNTLLKEQRFMVRRALRLIETSGLLQQGTDFEGVTLRPIERSAVQALDRNTFEKKFVTLLDAA